MSLKEWLGSLFPHRACEKSRTWLDERIRDCSVWSDIRAFPPLAIWGGVHCVAALILARRFADAGSLKLTVTQLCLTATIAALLTVAARAMLARIERRPPAPWLRLVAAFVSAAPIVTLFFASAKRLPMGTMAYLGTVALGTGAATWLWHRVFVEQLLMSLLLSPDAPAFARPPRIDPAGGHGSRSPEQRDPTESLRLKRAAGIDGSDRVEGMITAEFARGQTVTTLHIPFLPTFPRAPELVCEIDDRAAARIKGTAVYPYGCRLELKRTCDLSESVRVNVRFTATLSASVSRAA